MLARFTIADTPLLADSFVVRWANLGDGPALIMSIPVCVQKLPPSSFCQFSAPIFHRRHGCQRRVALQPGRELEAELHHLSLSAAIVGPTVWQPGFPLELVNDKSIVLFSVLHQLCHNLGEAEEHGQVRDSALWRGGEQSMTFPVRGLRRIALFAIRVTVRSAQSASERWHLSPLPRHQPFVPLPSTKTRSKARSQALCWSL